MRTPSKRTFENDKAVQRQVSLGPPGRRLPLPRSARVGPSAHTVEVELDDATRQELEAYIKARLAAENGGALDPDVDTMILTHIGCNALRACLPREARAAIKRFKAGDYRVIWIHNLPQQSFPATPVDGFCDERELALTNALHLGLIALVGMVPYAVPYENDGKLMRNVVPNPQAAATSSWGFRKEFFWHTDNPHLQFGKPHSNPRPFIPGFLTFLAVRNVEEVPTELLAVDDVVRTLPPGVREALTRDLFDVAAPDSNDALTDGERMTLSSAPVLELVREGYRARFDVGTTEGRTPEAEQALEAWEDALKKAEALQPILRPGDFLGFDNTLLMHKRGGFEPEPGNERWLRRCYASR